MATGYSGVVKEVIEKERGAGGRVVVADPARVSCPIEGRRGRGGEGSGRTNAGSRGAVSFGVLARAIVAKMEAGVILETGWSAAAEQQEGCRGGEEEESEEHLTLPTQDKPASEEQNHSQREESRALIGCGEGGEGFDEAHAAAPGPSFGRAKVVA